MKLRHVLEDFGREPWAILPSKLEAMTEVLLWHAAGNPVPKYEAAAPRSAATQGGIAVIPVFGIISPRMNLMTAMSGGTSTDQLAAQIDEAVKAPDIKGIVLDVSSPGGNVYGVPELASRIFNARGQKRIVAAANYQMASAAYWIGSAADEIFMSPSAEAGSIGVVAQHIDLSKAYEAEGVKVTLIHYGKHKVEGNDTEPLPDEARAYMQSRVDDYGRMFDKAVAQHRNVSVETVQETFGQGRMFGAKDAVKLGMADRIGTLQDAIERAAVRLTNRSEDRARLLALLERTT
jgi:signal peptide peptidase SppA